MKTRVVVFILLFITIVFYHPFFLKGQIPLPGDIVLGAYHPWKDQSWGKFNPPYPYKVFESQDAVNFYYPIKLEITRQLRKLHLPFWNQYNLNGTPLLGDGHSGALYPLNLLLLFGDFNFGWSIFVISQPFLASLFFYFYLRKHQVVSFSALFGGISYGFGSYIINQTELANIGHTALWLPLVLLGVDFFRDNTRQAILITAVSATMMFLSGFMQIFVYGAILTAIYFFFSGYKIQRYISAVLITFMIFCLLSGVQLLPYLSFLPHTVRWHGVGTEMPAVQWLLDFKLLITLFVPDFYGHPATANWSGGIAYYESVAYLGPYLLVFLYCSLNSKKRIKKFFFWTIIATLIMVIKNPLSLFFYSGGIPLMSSLTPSRLLITLILAFSVLVALGSEEMMRLNKNNRIRIFFYLTIIYGIVFIISNNKHVLLPLLFSFIGFICSIIFTFPKHLIISLMIITLMSLYYQGHKYLGFIPTNMVFPKTKTIEFLQNNLDGYRYLSIHPEVFPSNMNIIYSLSTSNGYHPIHDYEYHQITSKLQFQSDEQHFGRTIFLTRINQPIINFTDTKYIINLGDITDPSALSLVTKVFSEGETTIYEILSPPEKGIKKMPAIYYSQQKWARIGLVVSSIGLVIFFILYRNIYNK